MLTAEQNALLTQVCDGAPMGDLLRRYWIPIAGVSEFDRIAIKAVRFFGEDLVLYKDASGNFGLVDRHCPHRRADLAYGFVEECGIRCNYHGWLFERDGRCIEQPFEDTANPGAAFREKVRIRAYQVRPLGGILWAYMGPDPAPILPIWEPFSWSNGFVQVYSAKVPCNWLQCQENSIDPVHFEWMHRNWTARLKSDTATYGKKHVRLDFKEFEYGFTYHRLVEDMAETHPRWAIGRICLWPNCLGPLFHFEWRVPIDDENTFSIHWHYTRVPRDCEPYVQERIPAWEGPLTDPITGQLITTHVTNQDFIAWIGQGRIADRTKEMLGPSDRGIILMRRRFFEDIQRVQNGADPSGLIRDGDPNRVISLPLMNRALVAEGLTRSEVYADPGLDPRRKFRVQYGQPEWVRREFLKAMGVDDSESVGSGGVDVLLETTAGSRVIWAD